MPKVHLGWVQVENAKVQKRKYRNGRMEVRRKKAYWFLVSYWLMTVCVEAQYVDCLPVIWEPDPGVSDAMVG